MDNTKDERLYMQMVTELETEKVEHIVVAVEQTNLPPSDEGYDDISESWLWFVLIAIASDTSHDFFCLFFCFFCTKKLFLFETGARFRA